jgi:hypothetical protein
MLFSLAFSTHPFRTQSLDLAWRGAEAYHFLALAQVFSFPALWCTAAHDSFLSPNSRRIATFFRVWVERDGCAKKVCVLNAKFSLDFGKNASAPTVRGRGRRGDEDGAASDGLRRSDRGERNLLADCSDGAVQQGTRPKSHWIESSESRYSHHDSHRFKLTSN